MPGVQELVGYVVLDRFEECFEYVENECYIGSTAGSAYQYSRLCMGDVDDYEIQEVSFRDMLEDFGGSSGCYAMEQTALRRFETIAKQNGLEFSTETRVDFDLVFVEFRVKTD